jgi:uncharacterized protein YndB with AHSA1/START domain
VTEESDRIIDAQADDVHRDLAIDRDGTQQHTVQTISQSYPTTPEDLWEACTRADRLARWFSPVTGELRLGGRYQVEGNASGEVVACDPPRSFTVTWEFGGDSSRLTVRVEPAGERARLTIRHEHTGDAGSPFWAQFGPGATGVGWDLALLGLSLYLVAGQDRPTDPASFAQAEPARRFIRAASDRWGAASTRAGTPANDAAAAAARTAAFYLGEQAGG